MAQQNIVEIIIKALDNTKSGLSSPITNLQSLQTNLGKLNTFFHIGEAAAAYFFERLVQHSIEGAASLQTMSEKTGVSVEALSTLKYAAEQSDTNIESLSTGLKKMSTYMLQAAQGNKTAQAAFSQLGVSVQNADGTLKSQQQVLLEVATSFSKLQDGAAKSALAVQIFGRSGTELIPFLNKGASGITALQEKAQSLGLEISGGTARSALAFENALKDLVSAVDGLGNRIITWMLPGLTRLTQEFASTFEKGQALSNVFDGISATLHLVWQAVMLVVGELEILFKVMADVTAGLFTFFAAWKEGGWKEAKASIAAIGQQLKTDVIQSLNNTVLATNQAGTAVEDMGKKANLAVKSLQQIKITAGDIKKAFDEVHPDVAKFFETYQKLGTGAIKSVKGAVLELSAVLVTSFDQGAKTALNDLIAGGKKAKEAFTALGDAMVKGVVDWLAQMALAKVEQAAMHALGDALLGSSVASASAAAAGVGAAWSGPAAAVSLATFGANAGPSQAAILSTAAVSKGAFSSFAVGSDYIQKTGMALIHQGERVVPAKTNQDLTKALGNVGGGSAQPTRVSIQIDGKEIANAMLNQQRLGFFPK